MIFEFFVRRRIAKRVKRELEAAIFKTAVDYSRYAVTKAACSPLPHNNLNHCNAAGCDGVSCGPEHIKGDF